MRVPSDTQELQGYAEARDEDCGTHDYKWLLRQLVFRTKSKYPALHEYLKSVMKSHQELCANHPKQVVANFKSTERSQWKLVAGLVETADKLGLRVSNNDNNDEHDNKSRMRDALQALVDKERDRRARSGLVRADRSLARAVERACNSFAHTAGSVLRAAVVRPRAGTRRWITGVVA